MKLSTLIIFFAITNIAAQDTEGCLRKSAIEIINLENLGPSIAKQLKPFKIIMIGEMHGTNEPAEFLVGLVKCLAPDETPIQVGIEIPGDMMPEHSAKFSDDSLIANAYFFRSGFGDGRSSVAWYNMLAGLNKIPNVELFFFDVTKDWQKISGNRDSLMYINIKNQMGKHPGSIFITLSGNIHNMLSPFKDRKTAACYLMSDKDLNIRNKICSINHNYQSGTMLNNTGDGLAKKDTNMGLTVFSNSSPFENYFALCNSWAYSAVFYTTKVTASKLLFGK
jgi:hypothetical protein